MAIDNNQFLEIDDIIKEKDIDIRKKKDAIKQKFEPFLQDCLEYLTSRYKNVEDYKIIGFDEYLFNTNYEDSAVIKYFACLKLPQTNLNLQCLRKKKAKISKKQKMLNEILYTNQNVYPILEDVAVDIYNEIKKSLSSNDLIFVRNGVVRITLNQEDVVDVYVAYELNENEINYFKNTKWFKVNILDYYNNFYQKNSVTNNNFCRMIKIFKSLEKEVVYAGISQNYISKKENLVENLLYNVPNDYFVEDYKQSFLKCINYLLNKNFDNFVTIDNVKMFDLYEYKIDESKNLIRKIMYAYNNFDTIIEMTQKNFAEIQNEENLENEDQNQNNQDLHFNRDKSSNKNPYEEFKNKFNNK